MSPVQKLEIRRDTVAELLTLIREPQAVAVLKGARAAYTVALAELATAFAYRPSVDHFALMDALTRRPSVAEPEPEQTPEPEGEPEPEAEAEAEAEAEPDAEPPKEPEPPPAPRPAAAIRGPALTPDRKALIRDLWHKGHYVPEIVARANAIDTHAPAVTPPGVQSLALRQNWIGLKDVRKRLSGGATVTPPGPPRPVLPESKPEAGTAVIAVKSLRQFEHTSLPEATGEPARIPGSGMPPNGGCAGLAPAATMAEAAARLRARALLAGGLLGKHLGVTQVASMTGLPFGQVEVIARTLADEAGA